MGSRPRPLKVKASILEALLSECPLQCFHVTFDSPAKPTGWS